MLIFFQENRNLGNCLCRLLVSVINGEPRENLPEKNFRRKGFTLKFSLKMGFGPFLFPKETQSNVNPICAAAMRRNGDYYETARCHL